MGVLLAGRAPTPRAARPALARSRGLRSRKSARAPLNRQIVMTAFPSTRFAPTWRRASGTSSSE